MALSFMDNFQSRLSGAQMEKLAYILLIAAAIQPGRSMQCYSCRDTILSSSCKDTFENKNFEYDCGETETKCVKVKQISDDTVTVTRTCGLLYDSLLQRRDDDDDPDGTTVINFCYTELCNGSARQTTSLFSTLLLSSCFFILRLFIRL
ncbi:uncharacterized protein [Periplaneta americana]|uniref:uncharacterized protein n=1 Tax=Periplaneta americana TaxID=6978 RepID=UPI0037E81780